MALLDNTKVLDAIVKISNGTFGSFENKQTETGALSAFKENGAKLLPESSITTIKKSTRQATKIPVLNKFTPSLITAPSCSVTGNRSVSAMKSITWAYIGFQTKVIPTVNADNYISVVDDLANQMFNGWKAVFSSLDTNCVSALESAKSTTLEAAKNATAGAGLYNYTKALDKFFIYAPAVMRLNDLTGPYVNIANTESASNLLAMQTLALQNSQNLAGTLGTLPLAADWQHYTTNRLSPGAHEEVHYLAPQGAFGIYNWVDPDSVAGRTTGNKSWGMMQDPYYGFDWGVYAVDDCADASAEVDGATRVYTESMEIGAYFAIVTDYSSDTSSPIIKFTNNPA